MSDEQGRSLRQQIDDTIVDARNEVIVQATNAFLLVRQVMLTGLGFTFIGVDHLQDLLQQAVARGEVVESDAQQRVAALRRTVTEGANRMIPSQLAAVLDKAPGGTTVPAPATAPDPAHLSAQQAGKP